MSRIRSARKRHDVGLGGFAFVSLRATREGTAAIRQKAFAGINPCTERQREAREREAARRAAAEAQPWILRTAAAAWITALAPGRKDTETVMLRRGCPGRSAHPAIGDMPLADRDRAAIMRAMAEVWRERPAAARTLRRRIATALRRAAAHRCCGSDNPADARTLRHGGLPALTGGCTVPSLPLPRLPTSWASLDVVERLGALRLAILTCLRSKEVRLARLNRIGPPPLVFVLTVPSVVMNAWHSPDGEANRVPPGSAALAVLARTCREACGVPCFAAGLPKRTALGQGPDLPDDGRITSISDMTLSEVMRRMNEARPDGAPPPWRDADRR